MIRGMYQIQASPIALSRPCLVLMFNHAGTILLSLDLASRYYFLDKVLHFDRVPAV